MKKLNVVLLCPEIPQNTGNISRTCAVCGAALHIIRPIGFEISDRTLKRAGLDYWDKLSVTYYENFEEFMEKNGASVGVDAVDFSALSMTKDERMRPEIINGSRRKRIAQGSGTTVEDLNKLLRQFDQMKKMMKQISGMGKRGLRGMKLPFNI